MEVSISEKYPIKCLDFDFRKQILTVHLKKSPACLPGDENPGCPMIAVLVWPTGSWAGPMRLWDLNFGASFGRAGGKGP